MKQLFENHSSKFFIGGLVILLIVLGFHNFIQLHPVGPHFIRQVDGFAFVDYYQQNGFNFFETGGWYLAESNGRTASEFPILYFLTALSGKLIGYEHVILRLFTLIISMLGFYHLFLLLKIVLKQTLLALIFSLLFLSSTVVLYYSVNFLPDASALGLTLSAWYFAFRAIYEGRKASIVISFLFFLFAGLLKVTFLIHPIAFIVVLLLRGLKERKGILHAFKSNLKSLVWFFGIMIGVFCWYAYASAYNNWYSSNVFLTTIRPIWEMDSSSISRTWLAIHHDWFSSYYYQTTFHVFIGVSLFGTFLGKFRKIDFLGNVVVILGIGSLIYCFLFFLQFKDHDYYMLNCAPFIFFLVIHAFRNMMNRIPKVFKHWGVSVAMVVLTILSLFYASGKLNERFTTVSPLFEKNVQHLKGIDKYFDDIGIPAEATFLVLSDETFNGAFYYMKRYGWPVRKDELNLHNQEQYPQADFILITPDVPKEFHANKKLVGEYNSVKIYK